MDDTKFKDKLKEYQNFINIHLDQNFNDIQCYEKELNKSMKYSLMAGGKRLRPILIIASYELFKNDTDICIPYCMAMEMIHNFSLIHDDLPAIDNDNFRHNIPTNHKVFGESTAILAGDLLLNKAYCAICTDIANEKDSELLSRKILAFKEICMSTSSMIQGEYLDTLWENDNISLDKLEYMHKNKTGALICASVRIGAILAGCNNEELQKLTNYANKIGLAFQVKDDILSEIGNEKILGKPVGNDRALKKSTYVTIFGLKKSEEILDKLVKEAIEEIQEINNNWFLNELAIYIKNRQQ